MIRNQWYAVLNSSEVKIGKPIGVTRMGEKLVFWRNQQGQISCFRDICPHRGAALSIGKLINDHLQCPFHGLEFDSSGRCTKIPANGATTDPPKAFTVHKYLAREEHEFIWLWWGEPGENLPPVPFFDNINSSFAHITMQDHWRSHYSRAIENQLDVVHIPFLHRTTIGRGNRTVVDGPLASWLNDDPQSNLLNIWVYNRIEDGVPARSARLIPIPTRPPNLKFCFPNLWQNRISNDFRLVVAFAPIDDSNTMMYLRTYQRTINLPLLRELFNLFSLLGNFIIERQDRWVVETQLPKQSALDIGEKLIPGDRPIIEYRRRRQELIKESAARGNSNHTNI